jgi:hypothetical protein
MHKKILDAILGTAAVQRAQAKVGAVTKSLGVASDADGQVRDRLREANRIANPLVTMNRNDSGSDDPVARLQAIAALPRLNAEVAVTEAAVIQCRRDLEIAKNELRLEVKQAAVPHQRAAVRALHDALSVCRESNAAVERLQVFLHEATGEFFDTLSWPELTASTPTLTSRFDLWRDAAARYGFLD